MAHREQHAFAIVTQDDTDPNRFTYLEPLPGLRLEFPTRQEAQAVVGQLRALKGGRALGIVCSHGV